MKTSRILALVMIAAFGLGILSSCAGDPRKNCNHPQHGQWAKEKRSKKYGF